MSLIPCPDCSKKEVSTSASNCPSCGCDIQKFLKDKLCQNAIGFPIRPFYYWYEWCFWYYWGCRHDLIGLAKPGWLDAGASIMNIEDAFVKSPFPGLVLHSGIKLTNKIDVGAGFQCDKFVVVQPLKSYVSSEAEPFNKYEISGSFQPFIDAIWDAEHSGDFFELLFKKIFKRPSRFNMKEHFSSREQLLEKAKELNNVFAIWLPGCWDFDYEQYYFDNS